jgi:4-amino-4-deoxy-L-arabinose transferase-like glycosyltransferase
MPGHQTRMYHERPDFGRRSLMNQNVAAGVLQVASRGVSSVSSRVASISSRMASLVAPSTKNPVIRRGQGALKRLSAGVQRGLADRWLMAAIVISLVAFILRLVGVSFGLPNHYHWDEPTIVNRAIRMGSGDLNPHFFYYPGLTFYLTFAGEALIFAVGRVLHIYPTTDAFAAAYFTDSTPFYLVGRVVGALLGAATCLLTYLVGKRVFGQVVGLLGAGILAVSLVSVANGHFITNDVPMAFFAMLAYLWIWQVYTRGRTRDYVLAAIAIGLGVATKYLPVVLLASLVLAHLLRLRRERGRWRFDWADLTPLALSVGVTVATFFVFSPFSFLDWRNALHDYIAQGQLSSAAGDTTSPLNFVPYLSSTLPWSIGWPAYLAALGGLIAIVRAHDMRRWELILFSSFPVLFFLVIGSARQPWARWLVTLQPFLALAAAAVAWWLAQQAPRWWRRYLPRTQFSDAQVRTAAFSVLAICLLAPSAIASLGYDHFLTQADPRTRAAEWFSAHVPTTTTIAVQPLFDRYFLNAPIMTTSQLTSLESDIPANKTTVRFMVEEYYHARPIYPDVPFVYDLAKLRAAGVRYVVLSSASTHSSSDLAAEDRFYAELNATAKVAAQFGPASDLPDAGNFPVSSPTITIYDIA